MFVPNVAPGNSPNILIMSPTVWTYDLRPLMSGTSPETPTLWLSLDKFDWTGTVLLLAGMLTFAVVLIIGPGQSWQTPTVILLLFLGFLAFGSFVV